MFRPRLPFVSLVAPFVLVGLAAGCSGEHMRVAAAPAPLSVEFLGQWGVHGQAPGQLDQPAALAVDKVGRVYFADRGAGSVEKFTVDGEPLLSFEDGAIRRASGIAVDDGGGIYVADPHAGEIHIYFPEGDLLRVIRVAPQRQLDGPFIFSAGADGELFVPDPAGGRIQGLTPRGQINRVWRVSAGSAAGPAHPIAAVAGPDGFVYVGDEFSGRISKFRRRTHCRVG
jgi:hypothetical protein